MSFSNILSQVFARLEAATTLPDILYPNIEAPEQTANHLRVAIIPAGVDPVGISSGNQELGIIQVSVYCTQGTGAIVPALIAAAVLSLFPRNLALSGVRIDKPGTVNPGFLDGAWYVLPVSIHYQSIT
jgi:hypothetical protein